MKLINTPSAPNAAGSNGHSGSGARPSITWEAKDSVDAQLSRLLLAHIASNQMGKGGAREVVKSLIGLLSAMGRQRESLSAMVAAENFGLLYQPIVHLDARTLHHHEALLRLTPEPDELTADAGVFTQHVDALGLFEALDLVVCAKALAVLRAYPDAVIAVNISGRSMESEKFRYSLLDELDPASRLIIEITETAEISDLKTAVHTIHLLRDQGVRVCLDDFGSGFAAFRYLRELPINFLKIAGSSVRAVAHDARERDFVGNMCSLARSMGAAAISQDIETEIQATVLGELGATYGQGALLGRLSDNPFG